MNLEIANRLLQLRKQHRLSQEELAERLGISRQAVSKWERAEASPDTDNLILLARLYQVSLDDLLMTGDPVPGDPAAFPEREETNQTDNTEGQEENRADGLEKRESSLYFDRGIHVTDGKDQGHLGPGYLHVQDANGERVDIACK